MAQLTLAPLTRLELPLVEPWFDDPETKRYLGGRQWPARMLELGETSVGTVFRGQRVLACYRWLAWLGDQPVGYVDCGISDCWTICRAPDRSREPVVVEALPGPAGALTMTVDPLRRRRGVGTAMLDALLNQAALDTVRVLGAGVEPSNVASQRCLEAAGFRPYDEQPDWEGMLSYLLERRLSA